MLCKFYEMVKVKKKETRLVENSAKYERQKELARERQRRFKANMTEEQLQKKRARDRERRKWLREEKIIEQIAEMKAGEQKKPENYRKSIRQRTEKNKRLWKTPWGTPHLHQTMKMNPNR